MLGAILRNAGEPGPYDEPRTSPGLADGAPHAAVLELEGRVVELASLGLFDREPTLELRPLLERLGALAGDAKVTALVLRVGDLDLAPAVAEELRAGVAAVRAAGKPVHCHVEGASNLAYYVLTACTSIGLAPSGGLAITGAAATPIHLKGALDRLGIEADFLHVGAFKGAAEPLTRDRPSPEMVETLNAILDQTYATLVDGVAAGRGLTPDEVRDRIDTALFQGEAAVAARLVDRVGVFDAWRDGALEGKPWRVVPLDEEPGIARLMQMVGLAPRARPRGERIALVYAVGDVVDGKGDGVLGARQEIASRPLAAALATLAADDDVKAIVLRVDSPGGSALASEILWHAVAAAKARKPVVVSMGAVAASGGYYLAAGATRIFADATTLTGSIGVVGGKLAVGRALGKVGVAAYPMGRGRRALLWSGLGRWSEDERAAVRGLMEGTYAVFVERVAAGRGRPVAEIRGVAEGRVWTGVAALGKGLIDEQGGLAAALAYARAQAKLDDDADLEIYPPAPTLFDFLGSFGQVAMPHGLDAVAAAVGRELGIDAGVAAARLLRQALRFAGEPTQAVALGLPAVR
jgi:protease-4